MNTCIAASRPVMRFPSITRNPGKHSERRSALARPTRLFPPLRLIPRRLEIPVRGNCSPSPSPRTRSGESHVIGRRHRPRRRRRRRRRRYPRRAFPLITWISSNYRRRAAFGAFKLEIPHRSCLPLPFRRRIENAKRAAAISTTVFHGVILLR